MCSYCKKIINFTSSFAYSFMNHFKINQTCKFEMVSEKRSHIWEFEEIDNYATCKSCNNKSVIINTVINTVIAVIINTVKINPKNKTQSLRDHLFKTCR